MYVRNVRLKPDATDVRARRSARRRHRGGSVESRAAVAVPISFDAVPPRNITVGRRHVPEQTSVRAIAKQMTTDPNRIARLHVFALDADFGETGRTRRLERPRGHLTLIVLDVQVDPRVRDEQMQFLDLAVHRRPDGEVVVAV